MFLKIRKAKKGNLKTCAKILLTEFNKQGENWTKKTALARLTELLNDGGPCYCLFHDGKIVGFVFCETFTYEGKRLMISELAVSSEYQGKGFGKRAIEFVEKIAKRNKIKKIILAVNKKQKAAKIYKKLGFKPTGYEFFEKPV